MSADMYIHILDSEGEAVDEEIVRYFHTDGPVDEKWEQAYDKVSVTPAVWVGEVSWLKAALFDDAEHYVPAAIEAVHEIIGDDFPIIDDDLIARVDCALRSSNTTSYELAQTDSVLQFLNEYRGYRCFTVNW